MGDDGFVECIAANDPIFDTVVYGEWWGFRSIARELFRPDVIAKRGRIE